MSVESQKLKQGDREQIVRKLDDRWITDRSKSVWHSSKIFNEEQDSRVGVPDTPAITNHKSNSGWSARMERATSCDKARLCRRFKKKDWNDGSAGELVEGFRVTGRFFRTSDEVDLLLRVVMAGVGNALWVTGRRQSPNSALGNGVAWHVMTATEMPRLRTVIL